MLVARTVESSSDDRAVKSEKSRQSLILGDYRLLIENLLANALYVSLALGEENIVSFKLGILCLRAHFSSKSKLGQLLYSFCHFDTSEK